MAIVTLEMDFNLFIEVEYSINKRNNVVIKSGRIKGIVIPLGPTEKEMLATEIKNILEDDDDEGYEDEFLFFSAN